MAKRKSKGKGKPRRTAKLTAKTADVHVLYQKSVQDPPTDIKFIDRVYTKENGRKPSVLREDFCGTAFISATWANMKGERRAIGVDLHGPTLDWGRRHNLAEIGAAAARVTLLQQNVLDPVEQRADVTIAFNFSYCVFKTRDEMLAYCRAARAGLAGGGMFILDVHGGSENTSEAWETTDQGRFTYVWEQMPYDAVNGYGVRHIHFLFRDGTRIERAFTYDWRLWTLPELREILLDAGFRGVDVYWEGADERGDGNGIFRKVKAAEQEQSWVAYVVALK